MTTTMGAILAKRAFLQPDIEALVEVATGRRISFARLDDEVSSVAGALQEMGVGHGDRVAILCMNSTEFILAYLGTARLGAVAVPLNWRLTAEELEYIVGDSGAQVLVFGDEFVPSVTGLQPQAAGVRHWLHAGGEATRPAFATGLREAAEVAAPVAEAGQASEDDLLYLMYTSGTTGRPKGVVHTHLTTFWAFTDMTATTGDYRHGDRYLNCMPLFHVGALQPLNACLYTGATTILTRGPDPAGTWDLVTTEGITSFFAVPSALSVMAEGYDASRHDLSTLRNIVTAGAPVPVPLLERYVEMGIELRQGYGLTECGGPATMLLGPDAVKHLGSAGRAYLHADLRTVRTDGTPCDPGEPGEITVRSRGVMQGYWNLPEATAEALRDGWLRTGDIGVLDAEGFLTIVDRLKDMIISGGENVYPAELEAVLLTVPGVREAAVIGQPSARWGESPCAVVVRTDPSLDEAAVLGALDGRVARFKLPRSVQFVDELPRNASGKVRKPALRERFPGPAPE